MLLAPIYLFACLILGGSAQGIWQNMLLQLAGVGIIGWAAASRADEPLSRAARQLLAIAIGGMLLVVLQLIPLPASIWAHGARAAVVRGFAILGTAEPSLPISLAPYATLNSLLGIIPPLALYCAIVRLKAYRASWLALALLAGTVAGIMLGALQAASPDESSPWYLYPETNYGLAVGFFANANHMATLLVISLPFVAAIVAAGKSKNIQRYSALVAIAAGTALLLAVGLALNRSLAGYGLALPVVTVSALLIIPHGHRLRRWLVGLAALLLIIAVGAIATSSIGSNGLSRDANTAVQSREEILATSGKALHEFLPWGSGLGSFVPVYQLYESPDEVTTTYVVHAHNDYVEIALELGVGGILIVLAFLGWWVVAVRRVWTTTEPLAFARAASIASGAILAHSLVDYPLRTAAISACFAMCAALLADQRAAPVADKSALRPTRHLVFP